MNKPVCEEADDPGDLVPLQSEANRTKLRMIERQKGPSWRRRLDVPSRVGSDADPSIHLVELRAWLPLNHLTSGITKFANVAAGVLAHELCGSCQAADPHALRTRSEQLPEGTRS